MCMDLNQQDKFLLAMVNVNGDSIEWPHYIKRPFTQEPEWTVTSVNRDLQ